MNASSIARTAATPLKPPAYVAPSTGMGADATLPTARDNSFSTLLSQSAARAAASASSRAALPPVPTAAGAASQQAARAAQPQPPRPASAPAPSNDKAKPAEASNAGPRADESGAQQPTHASSADSKTGAPTDGKPAVDKGDADDAGAPADGTTASTQGADTAATDPKSMQARLRLAKQANDALAARGSDDAARADRTSDLLQGGRGVKGAGKGSPVDAASADDETGTASAKEKSAGADTAPLADLHAWLAAITLPPEASATGKAGAAAGKSSSNDGGDGGLAATAGKQGLLASQAMADDPRDVVVSSAAVESVAGQMLQAMEEGVGRAMESFGKQLEAASAGVAGVEGMSGSSAMAPTDAPMNGSTTATSDVPPSEFTLATPVDAPEFAQSLGVQVSLLARDGIGEAKLHLNPAEMGPIAINIVMDGSQAQVDFTVASAETRHAIEAGLPELASAMKEAGVTLSGGGVFDQPSQSSSGQPGQDSSNGGQPTRTDSRPAAAGDVGASSREAAAVVRRAATVSRGGVDTYA